MVNMSMCVIQCIRICTYSILCIHLSSLGKLPKMYVQLCITNSTGSGSRYLYVLEYLEVGVVVSNKKLLVKTDGHLSSQYPVH